eukprot:scaffold104304_cov18-Tisochrysis_lutea.AAC.2
MLLPALLAVMPFLCFQPFWLVVLVMLVVHAYSRLKEIVTQLNNTHSSVQLACLGVQEQRISRRTIDVITCIYAPLGMIILAYALWTYEIRSKFMRKKQVSGGEWMPSIQTAQGQRPLRPL